MTILQRYVPGQNKKELQGFLAKNDLDQYYEDPTEGATIDYLELRRATVCTNLNGWLDWKDDRSNFSLCIRYKNDAYMVFVFRFGQPVEETYYGPGPNLKRTLDFQGINVVGENVKNAVQKASTAKLTITE